METYIKLLKNIDLNKNIYLNIFILSIYSHKINFLYN